MSRHLPTRLAAALLSLLTVAPAQAGEQCLEGTVELYTTMHLFIEEQGFAEVNACIRSFFPESESLLEGWADTEGTFVQLDPDDPTSWKSSGGLAEAIETCYQVQTWPFFPPGTCGFPMYPAYEGDYDPTGFAGRDWAMRWHLTDCSSPPQGEFEFKVQVIRQNYCLDMLRDGFEE